MHARPSVLRPAGLLLLLPLLAAACGGGGSSASTTTAAAAPTTQKAFVNAANQVCIRADRRVYRLGRLSRDPSGWAKTVAAAHVGITEMRAITPPPAKAAVFTKMLDDAAQFAQALQNVHDALVKKTYQKAVTAQFSAARLQDRVHAQARLAGLTFCQQNLTNWPA